MAEDDLDPTEGDSETEPSDLETKIESIFDAFGGAMSRDEIRNVLVGIGGGGAETMTSGRPPRPVVSEQRSSDEELYNGPDKSWAQRFAAQHDGKAPTWEDRSDAMWGARFAQVTGRGPTLNDWRMHYYVKYDADDFDLAESNVQKETKQPYHAAHPVQIYLQPINPADLRAPKAPKATAPAASAAGGGTGGGGGASAGGGLDLDQQRKVAGDMTRLGLYTSGIQNWPSNLTQPLPYSYAPGVVGGMETPPSGPLTAFLPAGIDTTTAGLPQSPGPSANFGMAPPVIDTTTPLPPQIPFEGSTIPLSGYVPLSVQGNPVTGPEAPLNLFQQWLKRQLGYNRFTFE